MKLSGTHNYSTVCNFKPFTEGKTFLITVMSLSIRNHVSTQKAKHLQESQCEGHISAYIFYAS